MEPETREVREDASPSDSYFPSAELEAYLGFIRSGQAAAEENVVTSNPPSPKRRRKKATRVKRNPPPPITLPGYECVKGKVGTYWSKYRTPESIAELKDLVSLFCPRYRDKFIIEPCSDTDHVFLAASAHLPPLPLYIKHFFDTLSLSFPFNKFERVVLTAINVAPSQLHPNSWAFMKAFQVLCANQLDFLK